MFDPWSGFLLSTRQSCQFPAGQQWALLCLQSFLPSASHVQTAGINWLHEVPESLQNLEDVRPEHRMPYATLAKGNVTEAAGEVPICKANIKHHRPPFMVHPFHPAHPAHPGPESWTKSLQPHAFQASLLRNLETSDLVVRSPQPTPTILGPPRTSCGSSPSSIGTTHLLFTDIAARTATRRIINWNCESHKMSAPTSDQQNITHRSNPLQCLALFCPTIPWPVPIPPSGSTSSNTRNQPLQWKIWKIPHQATFSH